MAKPNLRQLPREASSWGFVPPKLSSVQLLINALKPPEVVSEKHENYQKMFPPRLIDQDSDSYKDKVGGDVRPEVMVVELSRRVV